MDEAALAYSISSLSQTKLPNNHQSLAQENRYSSPFTPDYDTVKAQQIISNSLKIGIQTLNHTVAQRMIITLTPEPLVTIINSETDPARIMITAHHHQMYTRNKYFYVLPRALWTTQSSGNNLKFSTIINRSFNRPQLLP